LGTDTLIDYNNFYRRQQFNTILKKAQYDYIIISYAYWANLIRDNNVARRSKLIIDTHDWLTAQDQNRKRFKIGKGFEDEISRLNNFDEIWTISSDEQYVFEQFCKKPVRLVPIGFESKVREIKKENRNDLHFDIIYIAGDNMHNIQACKWFFENVYELLPKEYAICVIGKVNKMVPHLANVTKIPFAAELDEYYLRSKIAICPMISGTGVKIKVVEALSYGLPVVCNRRGVDGLVNKTQNGCIIADTSDKFASAISRLVKEKDFYEKIANEGKLYFNEHHNIHTIYNGLDSILH